MIYVNLTMVYGVWLMVNAIQFDQFIPFQYSMICSAYIFMNLISFIIQTFIQLLWFNAHCSLRVFLLIHCHFFFQPSVGLIFSLISLILSNAWHCLICFVESTANAFFYCLILCYKMNSSQQFLWHSICILTIHTIIVVEW